MKKIIVTLVISVIVIAIGVAIGSVFIPLDQVFSVVINQLFGTNLIENIKPTNIAIIWNIRLPRVLLAFLVGAALSVGGAVAQSVLKNPLASPFTLGVSSGASLGAGIVIATGFTIPFIGRFTLPIAGLLFGMLTVIFAIMVAQKSDKILQSSTIILTGMVFSMFTNALLTLVAGIAGDKYDIIIKWQLGSFSSKGWDYVILMFPILFLCLATILFYARELDILTFGEEQAAAIGVETKQVKWILLLITAILTGAAVAFAGVIGFIDLISPHIVRRLFGAKHKLVIPMSALFGGIFMVICDLVARTIISPRELPIGVVTALLGAPFFAYIYLRKEKKC